MKIKNIVHLADIHIEKSTNRHEEYEGVFETLYISLEKRKPDRIVLVGDLFDDKLETSNEMYIIATKFIKNLSRLTDKVIITRGNHDLNIKNSKRIDTIETVLSPLELSNVYYRKRSGFYVDENVIWVVHDHLDKANPWH
jgi:metallophosphoesterase superfamily enzyme